MMTFAGLVFSVTILVLQQASNQFSPRVLRTFLRDRQSQLALGIFVGTFVYALLALRTVRGTSEGIELHVPSLSVWLAVVLSLLCVGTFIYYIHHVAQSIRAVVILTRIRDLLSAKAAAPAADAGPGDAGTTGAASSEKCGCRVPGGEKNDRGLLFSALVGLFAAFRFRRRSRA